MLTEMTARGAENDSTRNGRWLNRAYREIINRTDLPLARTTVVGSAGAGSVSVPSLRKVIAVFDTTGSRFRPLDRITFEDLTTDPMMLVEDIASTGTPQYWYYDGSTGVISTWPVGGTITAMIYKRVDELTGPDTPVFDEEYHLLIVDRAMVEVYKDNDEQDHASAAMQDFERALGLMIRDYMVNSREHDYVLVDPYDG